MGTRILSMQHLTQDLRFAVRAFVRSPRITIPAVLAR
jgi:hypothetical protein